MKRAVVILALAIAVSAVLSAYQHTPFPTLIDEAEATMIVCNPQPTPELIRWNKSRINRT